MGIVLPTLLEVALLLLLLFLVWMIFVLLTEQRNSTIQMRNYLINSLSALHTLSLGLASSTDPQEMAEIAVDGVPKVLDATAGCILLRGESTPGLDQVSTRGLSASSVNVLSANPMREYLASAVQRWGNLFVISDLHRPEAGRTPAGGFLHHKLINAMRAERFKSVVVIGLTTGGRTYGALLAGRRARNTFDAAELKLASTLGEHVSTAIDNWALTREVERRDEDLRALDRAGRAMRETSNLREQAAILRKHLATLMEGCDIAVAMQISPGGPLETVAPFEHCGDGETRERKAAGLAQEEVARTRKALLLREDWQWAKYSSGAGAGRIRTWCGVPVHLSDGSTAVLAVANFEREQAISAKHLEVIQAIAREAAGAFESALALQREERRSSQMALLNELGQKAAAVLNPQELLLNFCGQARKALGYDLVRIEVLDRQSEELVLEAEAGYGTEWVGRRSSLGRGLAGIAAKRGEPVVADAVRLGEPEFSPLVPGVRSAISVPLQYQKEVIGALTLESRRDLAFSSHDIRVFKSLADHLAIALHNGRAYQNALQQSITDGLTGLKTHRYFVEELDRELRSARRSGRPFAAMMIDLDKFKPMNDANGHLQGDRVLGRLGKILNDQVRQSSVLARYGGDEFAILLPDTTAEQAQVVAERLRESIEKDPSMAVHHLTASFGIAAYPEHGSSRNQILVAADSSLYLAKRENGNQVRVATFAPDSGQVNA